MSRRRVPDDAGNNVYSLTKHGVGAFSESLRQEVTRPRHVAINEMLIRPTEQER